MNDSDDPLVFIHVVDTWVQIALSDALFEIAKTMRSDTRHMQGALDAFDDIIRCNSPAVECNYPSTRAPRIAPASTTNAFTSNEEFIADAVLAKLGLDATCGPHLLGVDRWLAVRLRYREMFAHVVKSIGCGSAPCDAREGIELPELKDSGMTNSHGETEPMAAMWSARSSPERPAVSELTDEKPKRRRKSRKSAGKSQTSSPDHIQSGQAPPPANRTKARRCGEQLRALKRDAKGLLGRKD